MKATWRVFAPLGVCLLAACSTGDLLQPSNPESAPNLKLVSNRRAQFITVMSRNLYVGADLDAVITALISPDPSDDFPALLTAVATVQLTAYPLRAEVIADEVAKAHPHVIGLQEVSQIDVDLTPVGVPAVIHQDFLAILQAALAARGLNYTVAATVQNITAVPVPFISLVDFDVLLVDAERVSVQSAVGQNFQVNLGPVAPGVVIQRGWVAATATVAGNQYTFASTHLESGTFPGFDQLRAVQVAELLGTIGTGSPAVLMGDLNDLPGSPMYEVVTGAGFTDVWRALRPGATGNTCCHLKDLSDKHGRFDQRIDYVFTRGFDHVNKDVLGQVTLVGDTPSDRLEGPEFLIWPSDHAGVIADLLLPGGAELAAGR
jgi:endonuclease/exonuclease/phosphatase family metal-dependent hydrolase